MRAGEEREVAPEAIDLEGQGVATVEDRELRVPGLFAGERGRVRVEHVSRGGPVAIGRLLERTRSHPARREAPCPRHESRAGKCTGCPLMPLEVSAQRQQKRLMLQRLGLPVGEIVAAPEPLGYRWASKRVARGTREGLILGSYVRGTHRVASMQGCLVDHPKLREVADALEATARELGVRAWSPRQPRGLRYVWMKTNGAQVLVTLVWGDEDPAPARELAATLGEDVRVALSVQTGDGNALRGSPPAALTSEATLQVVLGGEAITYGPLGFLQPNPAVAALAYEELLRDGGGEPLRGALAFDLYAGAGVTTAMLRERFAQVAACESYPESAAALGVPPTDVATFLQAAEARPELVVANPPRKGLGAQVCDALLRLGPPRVHVMACGPKGLARDLARLQTGYTLESLEAYDTLPQTPHVELVAKLVREA